MEWPRSMQTMKIAVIKKSAIFVIVFTFQIYEQPLIKVKRGGANVNAYIIQTMTLQTLPTAEISSDENVWAWVSMVLYLEK